MAQQVTLDPLASRIEDEATQPSRCILARCEVCGRLARGVVVVEDRFGLQVRVPGGHAVPGYRCRS